MIYDGKKASLLLQAELQKRVATCIRPPALAILSVSSNHPSITSFITIKRKFAEAIGVTIKEYDFPETVHEDILIKQILTLVKSDDYDGIIVQLPLPVTINTKRVLDVIPINLDVDVLGTLAWESFVKIGTPIPPVASAIIYILQDTQIDITHKKVVIVGYGKLVGEPIATWFTQQGITPAIVDIHTDTRTRMKLYKEADIVISGIGSPHHLQPENFKQGVVLIDAGTSEQSGALTGDCNPLCATIANVFTPVPGGVGPLTVAHLFHNVITFAEKEHPNNILKV